MVVSLANYNFPYKFIYFVLHHRGYSFYHRLQIFSSSKHEPYHHCSYGVLGTASEHLLSVVYGKKKKGWIKEIDKVKKCKKC